MDFHHRVLLVGIPDPGLTSLGIDVRSIEVKHLDDALLSLPPGWVVVLGDSVLASIRPFALDALPPAPGCFVLACAPAASAEVVSAWARGSRCEFVSSSALVTRVLKVAQSPLRHRLSTEAWPPASEPDDPRWRAALVVLGDLPQLSTEEWAQALGLDRDRLYRLCRSVGGRPPERVVWECLCAA